MTTEAQSHIDDDMNADAPMSMRRLLHAPHRIFFFLGAIQLVVSIALWLLVMAGWYLSAVPTVQLAVSGIAVHAFLMLFGVFTFFVFGFLNTALPRWLGTQPVGRRRYTQIALCMALGLVIFYIGLVTGQVVVLAGSLVFVFGWVLGLAALYNVWRRSERVDKKFVLMPIGCVSAGALGALLFAGWLAASEPVLLRLSITVGIWLYLVLLIVAISHKLIPFFSSRILTGYARVHPGWTVPATLVCVAVHALLVIIGHAEFSVISDLPLAVIAVWHSYKWGFARSLREPLLGMLHISFAWLAIAMGLYSAQSLLVLVDAPFDLGMAPLHAIAIGYIASMVTAMASRVSLGHSGRSLVAGSLAITVFGLVQLTAIVRVLAELPPMGTGTIRMWLLMVAAVIWLFAFVTWGLRFGSIYLRPRIDGKTG